MGMEKGYREERKKDGKAREMDGIEEVVMVVVMVFVTWPLVMDVEMMYDH